MPVRPSDSEDDYFKNEELQKLKRSRRQAADATVAAEADRLKTKHWMRCPKCGMELAEVAFRGVQVDACFACGGMFFDKGEVDKLEAEPDPGFFSSITKLFSHD